MTASALSGCTADPPREQTRGAAQAAIESPTWESLTLAWGSGDGQVGLRPSGPEQPAEGPSAIAMSPSGEVLVLDRLNERLLSIGVDGTVHVRNTVPRDAEHLAMGTDGAAAAWSPLRATVWISGRDGSPLGELKVPRELRDIQRIELGLSHRVHITTSMQETLVLGSPRAPLDLASTLRTAREGAAFLADGRGVASRRLADGSGEIFVYRKPVKGADSKPEVAWTYTLPGKVDAVRVVGASGNVVCARVEKVTQDTALAVEREALCVEADTGHVLLEQPLGRPGLYTMHQELVVGGSPATLVFARPEEGGLRLERLSLSSKKTAEVAK